MRLNIVLLAPQTIAVPDLRGECTWSVLSWNVPSLESLDSFRCLRTRSSEALMKFQVELKKAAIWCLCGGNVTVGYAIMSAWQEVLFALCMRLGVPEDVAVCENLQSYLGEMGSLFARPRRISFCKRLLVPQHLFKLKEAIFSGMSWFI